MTDPGDSAPTLPGLVERRVESILEVARLHGTGVEVEELAALLPSAGPRDGGEVSRWLHDHPAVGEVDGRRAIRPGTAPSYSSLEERRARGARYQLVAKTLFDSTLARASPLLRCVGITGSAAYLEPEEGDDLDLMVVTRTGALWLYLAYAYTAQRLRPPAAESRVRTCLNYVLDDTSARLEFAEPRGFLVAREALMLRPLIGGTYYRQLLGSAPWLGTELPRMFARWAPEPSAGGPEAIPARLGIRLLNLVAFPLIASYLQLAGLVRNRRARRRGTPERMFRTRTGWHRLAFQSVRFDHLDALYASSSASPRTRAGARA